MLVRKKALVGHAPQFVVLIKYSVDYV